jgi:hypothetical protein
VLLRESPATPRARPSMPASSVPTAIGEPETASAPSQAAGGASPTASATGGVPVVGTGWRQVYPGGFIQLETHDTFTQYATASTHLVEAGVSYDRAGGVETFRLFNNDASNRGEVRLKNEYSSGLHQFSGDVRISPPTDDECVMQIFGAKSGGAAMMIRAYAANGGTLMLIRSRKVLASHIYGVWVHLNVVHDATANTVAVYVNGKLAATTPVDAAIHYMKYGIYGTLATASAQSQWRGVATYAK